MNIEFKTLNKDDIDQLLILERLCFSTPWTRKMFEEELKNDKVYYVVAVIEKKLVGYGGIWMVLDEGQITNIAVHPNFRRQKIGLGIVERILTKAKENGIDALTLEVRKSNLSGILFYQRIGFYVGGERKQYYKNPSEDAWIMWKKPL
jgi:ribosomal-protein-alanine N-acetyltransferase